MESTFNPDATIGAFQIGVLVSYVLFGITITQAYIYYSRFPEDSLRLKSLVFFIWCCELGHMICLGHVLYTYTISDYGHLAESVAQKLPLSFAIAVFFTGLIAATVHYFFAYRIYALSRKLFIPCILWALSFLGFVGAISQGAGMVRGTTLVFYEAKFTWVAITTWSLSVATDLGITVTLVFLFYRRRGEGLTKQTTAIVDRLIKWTLETGMLTSLFSILNLVLFLVLRDTFIWMGVFFIASRLFANSLLANSSSIPGILPSPTLLARFVPTKKRPPPFLALALASVIPRITAIPTPALLTLPYPLVDVPQSSPAPAVILGVDSKGHTT
ncbi:hypothetical protein K438DRAFT_1964026 [Mycena galopus ATCC 62051]|nr:hypothetical protein K438DRAFT_1964026 [Mycena galopus ATCC 62051]